MIGERLTRVTDTRELADRISMHRNYDCIVVTNVIVVLARSGAVIGRIFVWLIRPTADEFFSFPDDSSSLVCMPFVLRLVSDN